ncbi:MAG: glucose PTS transporter subunit IIA [Longicatena sp.]
MSKEQTVQDILKAIGGKDNITSATHCITRLRFSLKDKTFADVDQIKKIDGVIKAQFSGSQLQIVVGTDVAKYYKILIQSIGNLPKTSKNDTTNEAKEPFFNRLTKGISSVFIPLAIAIGSSGMIKAILAVLTVFKVIAPDSEAYIVLNMIGDATFYFLPVLIGVSLAKVINTNIYLSAALGGMLVYPTLINGAAQGLPALNFFGLSIPFVSYSSSVLPIVLGVFLLKYVYLGLNKIIPRSLEMVLTASLALLITSICTLVALAPLGDFIGVYIANFFVWLYSWAGPFTGALLGATFTILVMTGFCYGLYPGALQNLGTLGYDFTLIPIMLYSNVNQGVAAFAAGLKLKDKKLKANAFSVGFTATLGIMEPAVYTVNLIYKKPFYSALIGSAVAGFISAIFNVKAFSYAGSGLPALPAFVSNQFGNNFLYLLLCLLIGSVVTFVLTYVWTTKKDLNLSEENQDLVVLENTETINILSVGNGKTINLKDVPDKTFSEGVLGKTMAIDIKDGNIYSPFDGEVSVLFPTGHAIGLKSSQGVEVLIHIGIDTVKLSQGYFTPQVKQGDLIKRGQRLLSFDYEKLKSLDIYPTTIFVITNSQNYRRVQMTGKENYTINDSVFLIS